MQYWSGKFITQLKKNEVFVYGSNVLGVNGAGAAKAAMILGKLTGTKNGIAHGFNGQNTYALLTKILDNQLGAKDPKTGYIYNKTGYCSVSLEQITNNIKELYNIAKSPENLDKKFLISYQYDTWPNGSPKKSLNGYTSQEMLEMFVKDMDIPPNIVFHDSYKPHLDKILNKTSSNELIKEEASVEKEKSYTFFFEATSPFSQWHPSKFIYRDLDFICAEQFMMYAKAKTFSCHDVADKIINIEKCFIQSDGTFKNSEDKACYDLIIAFKNGEIDRTNVVSYKNIKTWKTVNGLIKKLGRDVMPYVDEIWVGKRKSVVGVASREKYTQNKDLYDLLINTGNTIMVEASKYDKIWGIGLDEATAKKTDPAKWPGQNLLGDVLTNLKNHFKLESKPSNKNKI